MLNGLIGVPILVLVRWPRRSRHFGTGGVKPVVFDRHPEIGLLTLGSPNSLEKSVMNRRREIFQSMGIEFRLNTEVGQDISVGELMETFDVTFWEWGPIPTWLVDSPRKSPRGLQSIAFLIVNRCLGFEKDPVSL